MIRVTLLRELGDRRMSLMDLQRQTGLSYSSLHAFAAGQTARYDTQALDKICAALGVGVGELLEHVADGAADLPVE